MLFDYLKKNSQKKNIEGYEDLLEEKVVWERLSEDDKTIKRSNMSRIRHALYQNLMSAIIFYQLEKERTQENDLQRKMILTRYLKDKLINSSKPSKDLSDLYTATINDLHKSKKAKEVKASLDYLDLHRLNDNLYYNIDVDAWTADKAMGDLNDSIDLYYCLTKLKYCTEAMIRQRALNEVHNVRLQNEVRLIADEFMDDSSPPLLQMYALCFDLYSNQKFNEKGLMQIIDLIKKPLDLDPTEQIIIFTFVTNYIYLSQKEISTFSKLSYEIEEIGFENDVFIDEGFLEPIKLLNYVFLCMRHGDGHKIPQVMKNYLDKVKNIGGTNKQEGQRDKTENICRAYHLFAIEKFAEAFELLSTKKYKTEPFFLHFRTLRIKSIYEAEKYSEKGFTFFDTTNTRTECKRFEDALKKRASIFHFNIYERNINFIKITLKIYKHSQNIEASNSQKNDLMEELNQINNIAYRVWLQNKINEL